jgi:hypothetical protein
MARRLTSGLFLLLETDHSNGVVGTKTKKSVTSSDASCIGFVDAKKPIVRNLPVLEI